MPASLVLIDGNQEMAYEDALEEDDYMEGEEEEEEDEDLEDVDLSQLVEQTSHVPSTSMKISIPVGRVNQPQIISQYNPPNIPEV